MKTKNLIVSSLFAALTAVCAIISIPTGSVPFSLSILGVFLTGIILGKKQAFFAQLIYILLGIIGVPVFSGLRGGFDIIAGPTGGYIIAYPFMSFVIAYIIEKTGKKVFVSYILGMLASLLICYSLGTLWLAHVLKMSLTQALFAGVVPFILFDLLKIAISAFIGLLIRKILSKTNLYIN